TAGVTFWAVFVDVDVVDDGGGHVFGHYCHLERRRLKNGSLCRSCRFEKYKTNQLKLTVAG
ncbi:MAG: hypothetical protein II791_03555, partial [Bacteroidales bacterium]|nr:hypothetical protein [Bacteroidales bacterium]